MAAGMDSVAVLLCTVPQGGVLGGLLLCVLVSLGELLLRVLGGLLVQVAGDRQVRLGDPRLAVCLVGVGPCGSLGNPGGRLGEPRLAVSLVNVLRGVLRGVERCVHGHAACGVLREGLLLQQNAGDRRQLLNPVIGCPLYLFLFGLLGPPGHVAGDGHVRLDCRLGENSLAGCLHTWLQLTASHSGMVWIPNMFNAGALYYDLTFCCVNWCDFFLFVNQSLCPTSSLNRHQPGYDYDISPVLYYLLASDLLYTLHSVVQNCSLKCYSCFCPKDSST